METIAFFSLVPTDEELPAARLLADGRDVGKVDGRCIEAQFRCRLGYLLITSDGIPLEEMAHIYLLRPDFRTMDRIRLGATYHSGIVRDFTPCGEDCIEFSFFGGSDRWKLTIRNIPKIIWLPLVSSIVRYPGGWLRPHYLQLDDISGQPLANGAGDRTAAAGQMPTSG
jgi:hypothetical protein